MCESGRGDLTKERRPASHPKSGDGRPLRRSEDGGGGVRGSVTSEGTVDTDDASEGRRRDNLDGAGLAVPSSAGWSANAAGTFAGMFSPVIIRDKYERPMEASLKPTL